MSNCKTIFEVNNSYNLVLFDTFELAEQFVKMFGKAESDQFKIIPRNLFKE